MSLFNPGPEDKELSEMLRKSDEAFRALKQQTAKADSERIELKREVKALKKQLAVILRRENARLTHEREGTMPRIIIKPKKDEDFYVEWSTIVEQPVDWGTRDDMLDIGTPPARLERADEAGTSAMWPNLTRPAYGWDRGDRTMILSDQGNIRSKDQPELSFQATFSIYDLKALCDSWDGSSFRPAPGLLEWIEYDDEE